MGNALTSSDSSSHSVAGPATAHLTRRRFAGILAGGALAAAALVAAPSAGAQTAQALPTGNWVTTAALNLRESSSTTSRVLAVIPAGTYLTTYSGEQNGFRSTVYNARNGWVAVAFLKQAGNSGSSDGPDPSQNFGASATVTVATNFRNGASTASTVIQVVAANTVVNIGTQVVNGFRAVAIGSKLGWMIDTSLRKAGTTPPPAGGGATGPATITAAANFRMDPSYGNNVIRVLPAGSAVTLSGRVSGDFVEASTPGDIGWIFKGLIKPGAPGNPNNPGGQTVTYRATATLNIREQTNASSRLLGTIPAGATCTGVITSANGYTPVTYKGISGYALTQFLATVPTANPNAA